MTSYKNLLHEIGQNWGLNPPPVLSRLYSEDEEPVFGDYTLYALSDVLSGEMRWAGILPTFLLLGEDCEERPFGLLVRGENDLPVVAYSEEGDYYYPVASSLGALIGQALLKDAFEKEQGGEECDVPAIAKTLKSLDLSEAWVEGTLPATHKQLLERVYHLDPGAVESALELASRLASAKEIEQAVRILVSVGDRFPWFADSFALLAQLQEQDGNEESALHNWWRVLECALFLSANADRYPLNDSESAPFQQLAADRCYALRDHWTPEYQSSALGRLLLMADPFGLADRLALAAAFEERGAPAEADRELLNALALANKPTELQAVYAALTTRFEQTGRAHLATVCRQDAERE